MEHPLVVGFDLARGVVGSPLSHPGPIEAFHRDPARLPAEVEVPDGPIAVPSLHRRRLGLELHIVEGLTSDVVFDGSVFREANLALVLKGRLFVDVGG